MSSSPQTSTRTTGTQRTQREARDRAAAHAVAQRAALRYEPYLDGLFTYCLSVLCDHDAATAVLGDVIAVADRRGHRCPAAPSDRRAWLYALGRWACLRRLAEAGHRGAGGRPTTPAGRPDDPVASGTATAVPPEVQAERRRELALLAWPEAADASPAQREALELAVRHRLAADEVAAVLGMEPPAARELLASAACEVERTRAALAVVETGTCPAVARFTGSDQLLFGGALRRELVRHVDDCPRCRRTAERAIPGRWPGTSVTPAELPVLPAPRTALWPAPTPRPRGRFTAPRFDRRGFPVDPRHLAARRDRRRARAVTTTVVATVVAAPVLAVWAAYRGTPVGEGRDPGSASAGEASGPHPGEDAGRATSPGSGLDTAAGPRGDVGTGVSVEVVGVAGAGRRGGEGLRVRARDSGGSTLVTLTATGRSPVRWSVSTNAPWLRPTPVAGTLRPGRTATVRVHVDATREPAGRWSGQVAVSPAGVVVSIEGRGTVPGPTPSAPWPGVPTPTPSVTPPEPAPPTTAVEEPPPEPIPTPSPPPEPTLPEPSPTGSGDVTPTPDENPTPTGSAAS
ncbi:hypothetical protein AAH978_16070 [Streptomyces sp. ZYX-F-203]